MPFILIWSKIKTTLIKLVLNTFISVKGLIILQNWPVLSPSEPDQLIRMIRRILAPFDSPRFTHRNLLLLVLNTFISVKGLIILQNCPVLSPSEPDQLLRMIRRILAPFDSPRFTHRNLTCFKSGVSQFSAISLHGN